MNIIPQMNLFEEDIFENLGDLERLKTILDAMDDAKLIHKLYKIRGKGRNDWPCEALWNSFIASFLFEHETVEGLRVNCAVINSCVPYAVLSQKQ